MTRAPWLGRPPGLSMFELQVGSELDTDQTRAPYAAALTVPFTGGPSYHPAATQQPAPPLPERTSECPARPPQTAQTAQSAHRLSSWPPRPPVPTALQGLASGTAAPLSRMVHGQVPERMPENPALPGQSRITRHLLAGLQARRRRQARQSPPVGRGRHALNFFKNPRRRTTASWSPAGPRCARTDKSLRCGSAIPTWRRQTHSIPFVRSMSHADA